MQTTDQSLARLDQMTARTCGVVRRLDIEDADMLRLKTLGICVGRQVEMVKVGDPLIVRVFGSRLGLASRLAARVWVEGCAGRCTCPAAQL